MRPSLRAPWLALSLIGAAPALAAEWPALDRPPVAEGGGSKDAAVVVGIGDYAYLSDIPGARANATAWYQWLKQTREVPVVRALFDEQGTRAGILEAAEQMAKRVQPGGTLWFVFVGHGAPSQAGDDGVLVGAAAQQRVLDFYPNTVRRQELLDLLEGGQQERLVVVLDACFSGRGGQGEALVKDLQPALLSGSWSPSRATVLTAGRSDQFAGPLPGGARPSFSYLLLGALRGWGDLDRDGQVTVAEAHSWVSDAMLELVTDRSQTPELQGADQDLVLSRGREPAPDLSAFVVGEGGGRPGELADQLAQLARAQQQREAAEAAAAEAAQKERELLARLEAERNEKLDSAEDQVLREAASMWARMAPIVASGAPRPSRRWSCTSRSTAAARSGSRTRPGATSARCAPPSWPGPRLGWARTGGTRGIRVVVPRVLRARARLASSGCGFRVEASGWGRVTGTLMRGRCTRCPWRASRCPGRR